MLERMKIGILGTGNMGTALGVGWTRSGHDVCFGSRDAAKAAKVAEEAGPNARAGSFDDAATFGDVLLYTLRDVPPTKLLRDAGVLDGKIVIDCNNSEFLDPARGTTPLARPGESFAERIAKDVPRARVVKAFNTHPAAVLALDADTLRPQRISAFVAGDDPAARDVVQQLARDVGLAPIDSGELDRAYLLEGLADFLRFQIVAMGHGAFTSLSLTAVAREDGAR